MITVKEQVYRQIVANPATHTTATLPASYIDMSSFERGVFVLHVGATDGVVDMKVVQATAAAGTGSKDLANAALTQITAAGDNKVYSIEFQANQLDLDNDFQFVAVTLTIAGTTILQCAFEGHNAGTAPVTIHADHAQQVTKLG